MELQKRRLFRFLLDPRKINFDTFGSRLPCERLSFQLDRLRLVTSPHTVEHQPTTQACAQLPGAKQRAHQLADSLLDTTLLTLRGAPALHSPAAAVLRAVARAASSTALTLTARGATARWRASGGGGGGGEAARVLQAETAALLHGCPAAATDGTCVCRVMASHCLGTVGERKANALAKPKIGECELNVTFASNKYRE
jgi:hypothetical protein